MPFFNRKTESDGSKPGTKQVRGRASDAVDVTSNASGAEPSPSEMGWITPKPNEENTKASGGSTASEAVPTYGGAAAEQLGLHGERAHEFHSSSVADVDTLDIDVPVDDNAKTAANNDNDDAIPYSYDDPSVDASVSGIVFTSEDLKKALDDNGDGVITADELYDDDDSIEPLENDMSPLFDKMFGADVYEDPAKLNNLITDLNACKGDFTIECTITGTYSQEHYSIPIDITHHNTARAGEHERLAGIACHGLRGEGERLAEIYLLAGGNVVTLEGYSLTIGGVAAHTQVIIGRACAGNGLDGGHAAALVTAERRNLVSIGGRNVAAIELKRRIYGHVVPVVIDVALPMGCPRGRKP